MKILISIFLCLLAFGCENRNDGKKSSIIDDLLNSSCQDTRLLIKNNELGDSFSIKRDVDFIFYTEDQKKADIVTSFINDNQYAKARFEKIQEKYRIKAVVNMPINQNILCSVSGLMTCVGHIFKVEYDGWGSVMQIPAKKQPE